MLGVFDSGLGGLQTLKYLKKSFPTFDFVFYADNKNVPYGEKSAQEIKKLTYDGLEFLFNKGASMVILACNTASSYAIRSWQNDFPQKKVLSVTVPGVEAIIEGGYKNVGILATKATVESNIYPNKIGELSYNSHIIINQVIASDLVNIIEQEIDDKEIIIENLSKYIQKLPEDIEVLVLGCTHYPILIDYIRQIFNKPIIDPSLESVKKLERYFINHQDILQNISKNGKTEIFTSYKPIENFSTFVF